MFGTNLHPLTFAFIVLQLLVIVPTIFILYKDKEDKNKHRFLILSILCLIYNISNGLIPNSNFIVDIRSQYYITFAIGILAACYSFFYIHNEHNIKIFSKDFVKAIIIGFIAWYMVSFVSLYSITNNLTLCRYIFFSYPIAISLYWFYKFRNWLIKTSYHNWSAFNKRKIFSGLIAMVSLFAFPAVLIIFEDNQPLERGVFNIGYISITYFFFYRFDHLISNDTVDLFNDRNFNNIFNNLTNRQKEILKVIYKNPDLSYTELADKLNISLSTFTTHTTNIYKSLNLVDKTKQGLLDYLEKLKKEL